MDPSVQRLWTSYLIAAGMDSAQPIPPAWHFCDNEVDANACVELVLAGRKRATAPSRWFFDSRGLALPAVNDLEIVTDWSGIARCIIRTTAVRVMPFRDVTEEHARLEGEGDGTLASWRATHWPYYHRELDGTRYTPAEDMPVVCQYFEVVFPGA